jgi:hypothetical protein
MFTKRNTVPFFAFKVNAPQTPEMPVFAMPTKGMNLMI